MMKLWVTLGVIAVTTEVAARERVNFDFGWRHKLGNNTPPPSPSPYPSPAPPPPPVHCSGVEVGYNWGSGGSSKKVANATECCTLCNADRTCGCWDFVPTPDPKHPTENCWLKTNCTTKVKEADRITGKSAQAPAPPTPVPGSKPAQSKPSFDDSSWLNVNAPHDMLIHQDLNGAAEFKMGYYFRNDGWYRKHFALPAEWKGTTVEVYIEGSFHRTQAWLNGVPLGLHQAGYTSFSLRLDNVPGVQFGPGATNVLAVYVDATTGTGWWYEGGGLFRHNWLVQNNAVHLATDMTWVFNNVTASGGAIFNTETTVVNDGASTASYLVRSTIVDPATGASVGTATSSVLEVGAGAEVTSRVAVHVDQVSLWSVQTPSLYTVMVEVLDSTAAGTDATSTHDAINITTGVRTVVWSSDTGMSLNGKAVKLRGFCDHSNFGGIGGAVPDRVNLFRAQALRAVGGNSWRMAHNPPAIARLDIMDALGMIAMDENRDYGGAVGQGGHTLESVTDELVDMSDLIKRDRNHASVVMWSFCNEVGCNNESSAKAFREVSKLWDNTRPVTQNHHGTALSSQYLDIQGFSHKHPSDFKQFHEENPTKPMLATECCSCMSQRGVDQDVCPNPKDGGCVNGPAVKPGTFYNNNIGKCTSEQVMYSDEPDYVAGTFVWSGFDYLGEARGWPQNTKCRGTVADVAGFTKETAYWIKSVWLSNISKSDAGRPVGVVGDSPYTTFIVESWVPGPAGYGSNRSINVYSNAAAIRLELNGKVVGMQHVPYFAAQVTFSVAYAPGQLTAVALDGSGAEVDRHSIATAGTATAMQFTVDAPSAATGTGDAVVADGEDVAMLRVMIVDSTGLMVPGSTNNISFSVVSGPGEVYTTHNGDPANVKSNDAPWNLAYHGLARVYIRTTADHATPAAHRRRLLQIDQDSTVYVHDPDAVTADDGPADIVVAASSPGLATVHVTIPVTADLSQLPVAVAARAARLGMAAAESETTSRAE